MKDIFSWLATNSDFIVHFNNVRFAVCSRSLDLEIINRYQLFFTKRRKQDDANKLQANSQSCFLLGLSRVSRTDGVWMLIFG